MDELTLNDKIYISSKKAAEITGYAKDYVGQLCREGRVEATLVGRSWYVLESSIRDHRFNKQEKEEAPEPVQALQKEEKMISAWEPTVYKTEPVTPIPPLREPERIRVEDDQPTDVASVWKEWFEKRDRMAGEIMPATAEELQAVPYTVEDKAVIEEEMFSFSNTVETEETVPIHRSNASYADIYRPANRQTPADLQIKREPEQKKRNNTIKRRGAQEGSLVLKALLIAVILVSISLALVGSGIVRTVYNTGLPQNIIFDYLGGTRNISK